MSGAQEPAHSNIYLAAFHRWMLLWTWNVLTSLSFQPSLFLLAPFWVVHQLYALTSHFDVCQLRSGPKTPW